MHGGFSACKPLSTLNASNQQKSTIIKLLLLGFAPAAIKSQTEAVVVRSECHFLIKNNVQYVLYCLDSRINRPYFIRGSHLCCC